MTEKQNVFNTVLDHEIDDKSVASSEDEIKDEKANKDGTIVGHMPLTERLQAGQAQEGQLDESENVLLDPFVPFDDLPPERERIVTIRAMLVGCVCGALVNASNLYLGLKTGWTFGASLFGSIVGFSVLVSITLLLCSAHMLTARRNPSQKRYQRTSPSSAAASVPARTTLYRPLLQPLAVYPAFSSLASLQCTN